MVDSGSFGKDYLLFGLKEAPLSVHGEGVNSQASMGDFWLEIIQQGLQAAWTHYIPRDVYSRFIGKVVRVRWTDPDLSFYIVFEPDGLILRRLYSGVVDARIRMRMSDLLGLFQGNDNVGVNVVGDADLVRDVLAMVRTFNIWSLMRWMLNSVMHDASKLNPLVRWLERFDPAWIEHLEPVPETLDRVYVQLRLNQHLLHTQADNMRALQSQNAWMMRAQIVMAASLLGLVGIALACVGAWNIGNF